MLNEEMIEVVLSRGRGTQGQCEVQRVFVMQRRETKTNNQLIKSEIKELPLPSSNRALRNHEKNHLKVDLCSHKLQVKWCRMKISNKSID